MFKNLPLWAKITLAMTFSLVLVGGILSYTNLRDLDQVIRNAETKELESHVLAVTNGIAAETRMAETMSALVANIPLVQKEFAAGNRKGLEKLFVPGFHVMKNKYGVRQFQFHTPPAISFLRVHKPAKFGDDLSSFRHTVVRTNEKLVPTRGLEVGVAGLGARGMVPVFYDGKHIGSVEFGMSFGQSFFDNFKAHNHVDVGLFLRDGNGFKTFASTLGKTHLLPAALLRKAEKGKPQLGHVTVDGVPRAVYAKVVNDYSGSPIGVIEVSMDSSAYQAALDTARDNAYRTGVLALLFGLALSLIIARGLTRRIGTIAVGVNRVAEGDLTFDIAVDGRDEIGMLGAAAQQMRTQLHQIAAQVLEHAGAVHNAAREIAGAVDSQAATSSQMSSSVAEITSTVEELSASSTQIADYSKSVVDIANTTWDSSKAGAQAMDLVVAKMGDIRNDNQESLREIVELGSKSKEITKVMEIINAVADQTKLIAFNAALEASSAGEAGRRFGVVAAEIRRLADSVTESTGEIEARVNEIQDSISRLVVASEKGASGIDEGMRESSNTAERLTELVDAASETTDAAQQISLSTQQQKTASGQVVVALREIVSASSNTAESIGRISEISKEMTTLSAGLSELVGQFRLSEKQ